MRTAYFSKTRQPGVVLRVSRITHGRSSTTRLNFSACVATPHNRCRKLRAVRSPVKSARMGPNTRASRSPGLMLPPSVAVTSTSTRSSISLKTVASSGNPATRPSTRLSNQAWPVRFSGTKARQVASPLRPSGATRSSSRADWAKIRTALSSSAPQGRGPEESVMAR